MHQYLARLGSLQISSSLVLYHMALDSSQMIEVFFMHKEYKSIVHSKVSKICQQVKNN